MRMRFMLILLVLTSALLAGCASNATAQAELPTNTPYPTYTACPTHTPYPAPTATPTSSIPAGVLVYNDLGVEQDRYGVVLHVTGLMLAPINAMKTHKHFDIFYDELVSDGAVTFGELDITAENTTDAPITIHPNIGTIVVGNEQTSTGIWFNAELGGTVYPNATLGGYVLFALKHSEPADVTQIRFYVDPPRGEGIDSSSDEQYELVIDLPHGE